MRKLGLLPTMDDALYGFSPGELNTHFSAISVSFQEDPTESYKIISTTNPNGFSFQPVTANDVILEVAHFKSQASGEDGIPHSIVTKALLVVAPHLVKLFSVSLARGVFPSSWKKARLIALKKVSSPSSPSEFRPIALLCFLSKVLEKHALDQIVAYLKNVNILDPFQLGFRKHHCTQSALLKLTNDILMGIGKKQATLLLCCSSASAKHSIQYHHISCWSNCKTWGSPSVSFLGPHLPSIGKQILESHRVR